MERRDFVEVVRERLADPCRLSRRPADPRALFRQLEDDEAPGGYSAIRASNLGACARLLAFRAAGVPAAGKAIDARSRANFAVGDYAEAFLTVALADALELEGRGWRLESYTQGGGQAEASLRLASGDEIPCHPDGVIVAPDGDRAVLEVKSASGWKAGRWQKAIRAGDPPISDADRYWWQVQAYMAALGVSAAYVLALGKDSGVLLGWWVPRSPAFLARASKHVSSALWALTPEEAPRQEAGGEELGPDDKGQLPWQCRYCSHHRACWPDARESVGYDWRGRARAKLIVEGEE